MTIQRFGFCAECKETFEVRTDGTPCPCPRCSTPWQQKMATGTHNLALQEKLYGTSNNPVWNEGLGCYTTGKSDRRAKARAKKLIPADE